MEMLELYRRNELVGRFELGQHGLEVGSGACCDVVVADSALAERQWLVMCSNGTVFAYDVSRGRRERRLGLPLARDIDFALGSDHSMRRVAPPPEPAPGATGEGTTQDLPRSAAGGALLLTIGAGSESRRIPLGERCLQIGRAADSDLVLSDLAVSERHARLEPAGGAIWVRDLGSRNGTFVDGVAVQTARVHNG